MSALTADVVARALCAAAKIHGVDPLSVLDRHKTPAKVRIVAAVALHRHGWASPAVAARVCRIANAAQLTPSKLTSMGLFSDHIASVLALVPVREDEAAARRVVRVPESPAARLERQAPRPAVSAGFAAPKGSGVVSAQTSPFAQSSPSATPNLPGLLRTRILEALADARLSAMTLATVLGVKENQVGQALSQLRHEGLAWCDGQGRHAPWALQREGAQ